MCAEMVRAVLDGRKTQTRRVLKFQPEQCQVDTLCSYNALIRGCPYGQVGDRLWMRETFLLRGRGKLAVYRADLDPVEAAGVGGMYGGWKPSIFMPQWASRITLEIQSVRVERLQEITEEDAKAEGVQACSQPIKFENKELAEIYESARWRGGFQKIWGSLNAKTHPWASNPFVWVIEFQKL